MELQNLYIKKETNTFTDIIECLGVARIVEQVFERNDLYPDIKIEDRGYLFQITFSRTLDDLLLQNCRPFDFFDYIAVKNENVTFTLSSIDYEKEKEIKKKYDNLTKEEKEKSDQTPSPNYDIFSNIYMLGGISSYQKSFHNIRKFFPQFPALLKIILQYYSQQNSFEDEFSKNVKNLLKAAKIDVPKPVNALQIINPSKGKGFSRLKADGIAPTTQTDFWLRQSVRFAGVWKCLSFRGVKVGTNSWDTKIYALHPGKIAYERLTKVYNGFKPKVRGSEAIKLDIVIILLTVIELIRYHEMYFDKWEPFQPNEIISGFQTVYLKDLGQNKAVTNIGFLGLPTFVKLDNKEEGDRWIELLEEHLGIIRWIPEERDSGVISMLQNYRQFISTGNFDLFFDFVFEYSTFLIADKIKDKKRINLQPFTLEMMEVLMDTQQNYSAILQNSGFRAFSRAIRNSTIVPIIHKNKKDVKFGLSQKIWNASRNKETLLTELSKIVQGYNESIMLKDYHSKIHNAYITTEELEEFCKLFDNDKYSPKLIGGLLVAFGYAKEPSKDQSTKDEGVQND